MIIGLLEIGLEGEIVRVVLVGRIGRSVAARRNHFDDEQRMGPTVVFRQDVGDVAGIGPLPRTICGCVPGGMTFAEKPGAPGAEPTPASRGVVAVRR